MAEKLHSSMCFLGVDERATQSRIFLPRFVRTRITFFPLNIYSYVRFFIVTYFQAHILFVYIFLFVFYIQYVLLILL